MSCDLALKTNEHHFKQPFLLCSLCTDVHSGVIMYRLILVIKVFLILSNCLLTTSMMTSHCFVILFLTGPL